MPSLLSKQVEYSLLLHRVDAMRHRRSQIYECMFHTCFAAFFLAFLVVQANTADRLEVSAGVYSIMEETKFPAYSQLYRNLFGDVPANATTTIASLIDLANVSTESYPPLVYNLITTEEDWWSWVINVLGPKLTQYQKTYIPLDAAVTVRQLRVRSSPSSCSLPRSPSSPPLSCYPPYTDSAVETDSPPGGGFSFTAHTYDPVVWGLNGIYPNKGYTAAVKVSNVVLVVSFLLSEQMKKNNGWGKADPRPPPVTHTRLGIL